MKYAVEMASCDMIYSNLVKDENGNLLADSHNILNRWKNYFSVIECT
jgi:hypothetical protein